MKSAFVAIIGRPSAGKSTLLNALCGEKVSITSPVPQTTRNKIRGILNRPEGQLVFLDTPGYHRSDKKFNNYLKDLVHSALNESDMVLYLVDSTRPLGREESDIIALLTKEKKPVILGLNKLDAPGQKQDELAAYLRLNTGLEKMFRLSALEEKGFEELLQEIFEQAPEGPPMYPEDYYTDQTPEFRIAEIIREEAIKRTEQEIPHALYVEVSDMEWKEEGGPKTLWVRCFLTVERDSQKGIVIGKGAEKIRAIRIASLKQFKKIFPYPMRLDLRVKVNKDWRKKDYLLKGILH
ncbi:MAG: GTPase Era [Spirochaetaceae bacterium]|jgi:GTP-binding protein Era|nr:GTPase Era [Spirochaetaceae bacterium]